MTVGVRLTDARPTLPDAVLLAAAYRKPELYWVCQGIALTSSGVVVPRFPLHGRGAAPLQGLRGLCTDPLGQAPEGVIYPQTHPLTSGSGPTTAACTGHGRLLMGLARGGREGGGAY